MRNILTILTFLLIQNCSFGQTSYEKIVKRFYTEIDSNHVLDCADSVSERLSMVYTYEIPEVPAPSSNITLESLHDYIVEYSGEAMYLDLIENYNQIPADVRKQFARSSYLIDAKITITHQTKSNFEWITGKVTFKIMFQSPTKRFKRGFLKKLFGKV